MLKKTTFLIFAHNFVKFVDKKIEQELNEFQSMNKIKH